MIRGLSFVGNLLPNVPRETTPPIRNTGISLTNLTLEALPFFTAWKYKGLNQLIDSTICQLNLLSNQRTGFCLFIF